ncbi:MAG: dTDP-4-dehydrorhamnose 3,5-epimerase family protein [Candidatus Vogelbacteria bacterium]|nr:dTDP-4-dehydrorhamnose 3,5-epimerase family protein [Candidatus Vogelbacteria bacterium]
MKITQTKLDGVLILNPDVFSDERGIFVKPFHKDTFIESGMSGVFEESFYSISNKDVIRGMHFQTPPQDHSKLIYVLSGAITDLILDLRIGSPTYGDFVSVELSVKNHTMVYIPTGFAHGFLSLEDNSCTVYMQSTMRSASHEGGISTDSFGMNWGVTNPIRSARDKTFPSLKDFKSPFIYTTK